MPPKAVLHEMLATLEEQNKTKQQQARTNQVGG
jgi:hypothetical protein